MKQWRYKVSLLLVSLVVCGLLGSPAPQPAASTAAVDPGQCHGPRQELKFAWLEPGEEPSVPVAGHSSICLAVYHLPGDPP